MTCLNFRGVGYTEPLADWRRSYQMNDPAFKKGDMVEKYQGARFWGEIVNEPWRPPVGPNMLVWHYDVMAIHPEFLGTTHIMVEHQMRAKI